MINVMSVPVTPKQWGANGLKKYGKNISDQQHFVATVDGYFELIRNI